MRLMRIFHAVVGLLSVFGLVACGEENEPLQAKWDVNHGFAMYAPARVKLSEQNHGLLWVTGPSVSMPLDMRPEQLPARTNLGATILYPDVTVPTAIAEGTKLDVHVVKEDGSLSGVVSELVVDPSPPGVTYGFFTNEAGQAQCYDGCNDTGGCNWCKACGTAQCVGIFNGPWVSATATHVCNTKYGSCGGGTLHACWDVVWVEECYFN
jgi:hypothetical protein